MITVIIPALNEAGMIGHCLATTRERLPQADLIVVDGGSADATVEIARSAGATVVGSARGRGVQCDFGARRATAPWLLFLHADTCLPVAAKPIVTAFVGSPNAQIATFRLRFDQPNWFLSACCWFTRIDSVCTRFGDQGILVRRSFYAEVGGFPAWPLFEDVALLQRARQRALIHSLPGCVTTSARRFEARGAVRQQWLNARLLFRYLCGASPEALAAKYRSLPAPPPAGWREDAALAPERSARKQLCLPR